MRIVFMGTPEFAVSPLEHLVLNRHRVVAVYTQPDKAAGRGRSLSASPVKRAALSLGLMVMQPERIRGEEVVTQLRSFTPDAIVVAAFGQILPQSVLDIPRYGCINIHPSLLPGYRGASPVAASILAGDEFTGVSIMLMDAGLDTGPVLLQAQIPVSPDDTTGSLTSKLSQISARLLEEALVGWTRGEIKPRQQKEEEASYAPSISKEDGEIDWKLTAVELWHRVRAFQPWPGCYTRWKDKRLKIIEALPVTVEINVTAGQVVSPLPDEDKPGAVVGVGTGNGVLGLLKVQIEGKQVMSSADFVRGHRDFIGSVLPN